MHIRLAYINDYEALCAIDSVAEKSVERCELIRIWLESACCCVSEENGQVMAYGVLTRHFFGQFFIEMVMVGKNFRRQGIGAAVIRYFQSKVHGSKLFSSTNLSNRPMTELFVRLGFERSGYINNLDEDDPEIIFYCLC